MKLGTLLICVLLSFAFAFVQKAEPQQPESPQGDRKAEVEKVVSAKKNGNVLPDRAATRSDG